jgi:hypothetical protein
MKTTEEVDRDMGAAQGTIKDLEARLGKALAQAEKNKRAREQISLTAFTSGDQRATRKLETARRRQRDAEMVAEDLTSALIAARQQIEALKAEREEAREHEAWLGFLKASETAKEQSVALAAAVTSVCEAMAAHDMTLRQMINLASEAGRATTVFRLRHALRFMESRLSKLLPHEYSKLPEPYRNGSYANFLAQQVETFVNGPQAQSADDAEPEDNKQTA